MPTRSIFWLLLALVACGGPPAPEAPALGHACTAADLPGCERALLAASDAQLPGLIEVYSRVAKQPSWLALWRTMKTRPAKPLLLTTRTATPPGFQRASLPSAPGTVSREQLVARLGAAAGRSLVALEQSAKVTLLFPGDALAAHELALTPQVRGETARLTHDAQLAAQLDEALSAAARFDYLGAAKHAEQLLARVGAAQASPESRLRAIRALSLLRRADLLPDDAAIPDHGVTEPSSAYAALMQTQLATHPDASWSRWRARIAASVGPARTALLDAMFARDRCPVVLAPPMQRLGDLLFAPQLALALDHGVGKQAARQPVPVIPAKAGIQRGKLALEPWLSRYERLTHMVEQSGTAWAYLGSLLAERGAIGGLSPEGTSSYARVSKLALAHVRALERLVLAQPGRYSPLSTSTWLESRAADGRLREALTALVDRSVQAEIDHADDASSIVDAALTAMSASASSVSRAAQLANLERMLGNKLAGPFGRQRGWSAAGVHALHAALAWILGKPEVLDTAGAGVADALTEHPGQTLPELARLAASAARYVRLIRKGELDATVSNANMFPAARLEARDALSHAIAVLYPSGPSTPAEKQLARELAELGDGLIAGLAAQRTDESAPRCRGDGAIPNGHPLRDSFNRLHKARRRMLEAHGFTSSDGDWAARARILALVFSDGLDVTDKSGDKAHFAITTHRAATILHAGLKSWLDPAAADVVEGGYLLVRAGLADEPAADEQVTVRGAGALAALSQLIEEPDDGLALLATLSKLLASLPADGDPVARLVTQATRAYESSRPEEGDLRLLVMLAVLRIREQPVPAEAIALADRHQRDVLLPLLVERERSGRQPPKALAEVARRAAARSCGRIDVEPVLAVRQALFDYAAGDTTKARDALRRVLDDAERDGLMIPKRIDRYRQRRGHTEFHVAQSISLGRGLLPAASGLSFGLSIANSQKSAGRLESDFADPDGSEAREDAARYYAHAALVLAVLDWLQGDDGNAVGSATRAVSALAIGVRLGRVRTLAEGRTPRWAADAGGELSIAAQLAADHGHPLLAGDLFTLARTSLAADADDARIDALLDPLPPPLRGLGGVAPVAARAANALGAVAGPLDCTKRRVDLTRFRRVSCETYPLALGLRAAEALPFLPHLSAKANDQRPRCHAWRELDRFLAAADEGRYDPDTFNAALDASIAAERWHDAAALMARHRHPRHCTPLIVRHARELAAHTELGVHLRADLLSIAANCDAAGNVDDDLVALEALAQRHPLPSRHVEVTAFAARRALEQDRWTALQRISSASGFVESWRELGPDMAVIALLIQHAAAVGAGVPIDTRATLAPYRLLCTTYPAKERGPVCGTIAILRSGQAADAKRRAAKAALADFVKRVAALLQPPTP